MDVKKLISEISIRSALWEKKDKNHHNRFVLDKLWEEVACQLNITRTTARKKWKALRDKFRTCLASLPNSKSEDAEYIANAISWQYFDSLLFLRDQFTPSSESTGNFISGDVQEEIGDVDEDVENSQLSSFKIKSAFYPEYSQSLDNDGYTPASSRSSSPSTSRSQNRKRQSKDDIGNALLELKSKKGQYLEKRRKMTEEDDDMNFFKSLLPHIRNFSSSNKMAYRMKVLEVTQSFLNKVE